MTGGISRRGALAIIGAGAACAAMGAAVAGAGTAVGPAAAPVRLIDSRIDPAIARAELPATDREAIVLGDNPVRQWRDGLRRALAGGGGAIALVHWDKAVMLQGLAREEGFAAAQRPTAGRMFRVTIRC